MHEVFNLLLMAVILINFYIMGSSRLVACVRAVALQGTILSMMPIVVNGFSLHSFMMSSIAIFLKGFFIPWLLLRAVQEVSIKKELEPLIGYVPTLMLGSAATGISFIFSDSLPLVAAHKGGLFIPTSLSTLFAGFLIIIGRRKAITQVLGYLIMENGIFIFGVILSGAMPLMIEAGVLLDLMVGVFVMGIVVNKIQSTFSEQNAENLSALRE